MDSWTTRRLRLICLQKRSKSRRFSKVLPTQHPRSFLLQSTFTMTTYYIIPGLGNSGEEHWQTYFERQGPNFIRIQQMEWDAPKCQDWIEAIEQALKGVDLREVVLVGHSLGCATIAHWAQQYHKVVKGAFLVAPSDLEAPLYTFPAEGFAPFPLQKLPFSSLVVASSNDPWVSLDRAKQFADAWGSNFLNIGEAGHINASAGFGDWPEGLELLGRL